MEWVIDGERWFGVTGADVGDQQLWENVAHKPFFPVLNVAVGSNFPSVGGQPDGDTAEGLGSGLQVGLRGSLGVCELDVLTSLFTG